MSRPFSEYTYYDAIGLAELVRKKSVHPSELVESAIERIESINPGLNAVISRFYDEARKTAKSKLPEGPFRGVPTLVKDLIHAIEGAPLTSGSKAFRNYISPQDSEFVKRLRNAGTIFLGQTNTPEFALMGITEPKFHGPTRNPWNLERTPGGSSGGAAAAVASGMVPVATGSDGGGSIRIPAAYCGLYGLKPTRGRTPVGPYVGRYWQGASVDHVLTRTVRDSAAFLDALSGIESGGAFSFDAKTGYLSEIKKPPGKLRIAFSTQSPIGTPVHPDCIESVLHTAKLLHSLGHKVEEKEAPVDGKAIGRAFITMYFGEVAAQIKNLEAILGRKARMGDVESVSWILGLLGRTVSAGEFVLNLQEWDKAAIAMETFHETYDVYLTPTTAMPPAKIGELEPKVGETIAMQIVGRLGLGRMLLASGLVDQLVEQSLSRTPFTQLANLTGQPSVSIPIGQTADQLPLGLQFTAAKRREDILFRLSAQLEKAAPWSNHK
ncbi:amidase [Leptospira gomenensis]|uniref:Amidase n=1 Tax=Leptospira gomenensis TaxID=2484974 RepID=A0A5F1Y6N2_9LEPT|nr:amidase family protein [Leptospira gomenensis]TGK28972.1 amidase [Leptospira gomenensis]TGK32795.1 amidase [Leptospira gomenensis]TGK40731.1 amidase [Leptospira gomenensis]TGK68425.1 amidase [Leptospira gomenensis]